MLFSPWVIGCYTLIYRIIKWFKAISKKWESSNSIYWLINRFWSFFSWDRPCWLARRWRKLVAVHINFPLTNLLQMLEICNRLQGFKGHVWSQTEFLGTQPHLHYDYCTLVNSTASPQNERDKRPIYEAV